MKLNELEGVKLPEEECCMCRKPMRAGRHQVSEGVSCEDCYFIRSLGDLENAPPGHAGSRR